MKLFISVLLLLSCSIAFGQQETLSIKISNIQKAKGQIIISIFNQAEDFPSSGKEFQKLVIPVEETPYIVTHTDLPKGQYAIALLHDENYDGECNFNLIGMPTEAYGFSKNVKPRFSIPSFKETKFDLKKSIALEIKLIK